MWKFLAGIKALNPFDKVDACSQLGIPRHLYINSRGKDNIFLDEETIYRRFTAEGSPEDWKNDGQVSAAIFQMKNDSVNRSKYSDSSDVLYNTIEEERGRHYIDHGIISLSVEKIRELSLEPLRVNGVTREFTFHLEHMPLPCMYPHTEIWFMEGEKRVDNKPPKSIRVAARQQLLSVCQIVKFPNALK